MQAAKPFRKRCYADTSSCNPPGCGSAGTGHCGDAGCRTAFQKNSDALWQIVSEKCLPHQQSGGEPAPCQRVDQRHRYAMLKDMHGPLQYLLIPLDRITGIESPRLLQSATPNYFALAWMSGLCLRSDAAHLLTIGSCHWLSIHSMAARRISSIFISPACDPMCVSSLIS